MRTAPHPNLTTTFRMMAGVVALGAVALVSGCGSTGGGSSATTTTAAPTTTTAATTTTAGGTTTTAKGGNSTSDPWTSDASQYRGQIGKKVAFDCPPGGTADTIWGVETYTDDSSVCTAGVHVGLITLATGGTVTIEIGPQQQSFEAGTANGITSEGYGSWGGSFTFPDAPPGSGTFEVSAASWQKTVASLALKVGQTAEVKCSAGGTLGTVWGTGTYTADSSICTAAVHHGLIKQADGGTVKVEVVAGQASYQGTTANGVTSQSYGAYGLGYDFPSGQPAA